MVLLQKASKWICPNMVHTVHTSKSSGTLCSDKPTNHPSSIKFTVFLLLGSSRTSFDGFRMADVATQYALTGSNSAPIFGANSAWPVEARIKRIGWTVTRNHPLMIV